MGINLEKRQTLFFLTLGRTRGGGGGGRGIFKPSEVFLSFSLDKKTSAADTFSRCLFIPRVHFETSLVMVNYYGYKL